MKQYLIFLGVVVVLLWSVRIGRQRYVKDDNETVLSVKELRKLEANGTLSKPVNYEKEYFSKEEVEMFVTRTAIPFVYHRDTISHKEISYWSRDKE